MSSIFVGGNSVFIEKELFIFGVSPINDDIIFEFLSKSSYGNLFYFYYEDETEDNIETIKSMISKNFSTYYFIPSKKFSSDSSKIENIDKYLINNI